MYGATLKIMKIEFKERADKGFKRAYFLDGVEESIDKTLTNKIHYDISSDNENEEQTLDN